VAVLEIAALSHPQRLWKKDVNAEYQRLVVAGVRFTQPPVDMGPVATAVLDDTCGNLIQIAQKK
jgi:hypothetical protein